MPDLSEQVGMVKESVSDVVDATFEVDGASFEKQGVRLASHLGRPAQVIGGKPLKDSKKQP